MIIRNISASQNTFSLMKMGEQGCWFPSLLLPLIVFFRKDSFTISSGTYVGRLTKIRIGHDNTGFGAAWFLDKVSWLGFSSQETGVCSTYNRSRECLAHAHDVS